MCFTYSNLAILDNTFAADNYLQGIKERVGCMRAFNNQSWKRTRLSLVSREFEKVPVDDGGRTAI